MAFLFADRLRVYNLKRDGSSNIFHFLLLAWYSSSLYCRHDATNISNFDYRSDPIVFISFVPSYAHRSLHMSLSSFKKFYDAFCDLIFRPRCHYERIHWSILLLLKTKVSLPKVNHLKCILALCSTILLDSLATRALPKVNVFMASFNLMVV